MDEQGEYQTKHRIIERDGRTVLYLDNGIPDVPPSGVMTDIRLLDAREYTEEFLEDAVELAAEGSEIGDVILCCTFEPDPETGKEWEPFQLVQHIYLDDSGIRRVAQIFVLLGYLCALTAREIEEEEGGDVCSGLEDLIFVEAYHEPTTP